MAIVAINSNDVEVSPADSFEGMVEHARGAGYSFDYLYDESQAIARALGSERTPEAFVLDADRRLVYHGAVDDNRDEGGVTQHPINRSIRLVQRLGKWRQQRGDRLACRFHRLCRLGR